MSPLFSELSIRDSIVPLSVEQYDRMGAAGIIDEKTELIRGVILRKINKSPLYSWTVTKLVEILSQPANGTYQETEIYSFDDTIELTDPISVEVKFRELT